MFIVIFLTALVQCRVTRFNRSQTSVMINKSLLPALERSQGGALLGSCYRKQEVQKP